MTQTNPRKPLRSRTTETSIQKVPAESDGRSDARAGRGMRVTWFVAALVAWLVWFVFLIVMAVRD